MEFSLEIASVALVGSLPQFSATADASVMRLFLGYFPSHFVGKFAYYLLYCSKHRRSCLIERPDGLATAKVNLLFNGLKINELEIDLEHINKGKAKKNARSRLQKSTVVNICTAFFANQILKPIGEKVFGNEYCRYFKLTKKYKGQLYRVVFCYCSDKPHTLGVITLFKEV